MLKIYLSPGLIIIHPAQTQDIPETDWHHHHYPAPVIDQKQTGYYLIFDETGPGQAVQSKDDTCPDQNDGMLSFLDTGKCQ